MWYVNKFNNWTIFFKEQLTVGPFIYTVTAAHLESMLRHFMIPKLQQHNILDTMIFMQDRAPQHTGTSVTQLLKQHFMNEWAIGQNFPTSWLP